MNLLTSIPGGVKDIMASPAEDDILPVKTEAQLRLGILVVRALTQASGETFISSPPKVNAKSKTFNYLKLIPS